MLGNKKSISNDTIKLGWSTHILIGGCLNCWNVKFGGKEILLFDWFILGESWGTGSCVPDIYESRYLFGSVQSGARTTLQTRTPTCTYVGLCASLWFESDDFSRSSKIQMDRNISISSALCAWARKRGGNCFPELFAGTKGNLTLLMANADAEVSSLLSYEHQSLESHCEASFA